MSKNPRGNETLLQHTSKQGSSLRTTVPAFIIGQMDLEKGDKFRWKIDRDNIIIEVVPKEKSTKLNQF